ncbi:MAG: CPBP family intramembrane glutamic endopeptidase [Bacillota bacterium]
MSRQPRPERRAPNVVVIGVVSMVFFIVVGVLLASILRHESLLPRLALNGLGVALGLAGAAACFVLAAAMYLAWPALRAISDAAAGKAVQVSLAQVGWFGLFFSVILPAIGEEVLFRGALQPSIGLIPAALLFGLSHGGWGKSSWPYAVSAAISGLFIGLVFQQTGSLSASMISHLVFNIAVSACMAKGWWPFKTVVATTGTGS